MISEDERSMHVMVGLIVGRVQPDNPWSGAYWRPVAVLPAPPSAEPWTPIGVEGVAERFYAGPVEIAFHRTETANYRDNLESSQPKIWVALRAEQDEPPIEIMAVTVDPAEGEALTEAGTQTVDVVPMPADIADALAAFVAEHHVEREFHKRRRDHADPEAFSKRGRKRGEEDEE